MSPRIAFVMIFLFFHLMGGSYFVLAPTLASGLIYWASFVVLGAAAGRKAFGCHTDRSGSAAA